MKQTISPFKRYLNQRRPVASIPRVMILSLLFAALTSCQTPSYNYDALRRAQPRSIAVIPPMNDSVEVEAPYIYLSTISKPLGEKGYYVFPVAVIENYLKENGLPTPAEMNNVPLDKIRDYIGADAVLYTHITDWGQKFEIFNSRTVVSVQLRLVDTRTAETLWDGHAFAQKQSNDGGGGLAGAVVGAIITQVLADAQDLTPDLARQANRLTINNAHSGLLPGPYYFAPL